jgi:hypothetical protein
MRNLSIRAHGRWLLAAGVLSLIAVVPTAVSAQTVPTQWAAALTGANEVPPTNSTATGTFAASFDAATTTVTWTLSVPSLTGITAAHLHTGAAGTNGGIVVNLYVPPSGTPPVNTLNLSGTARASDLIGSLAGNPAGFAAQLLAGTIYVNVHTSANPGGEIRGQVTPAQGAPAQTTPAQVTATAPPKAAATASPAPPKTGNAGLTSQGTAFGVVAVLTVLTAGVVAGGRLLGARNRAR